MTATSRTLPGTAANDTTSGAVDWVNPSNALTSNDTRATVAFTGAAFSRWLKLTNFGFTIPNDARIDGIKAELECRNNAAGTVITTQVRLVIAGTIQTTTGSLNSSSSDVWPTTEASLHYGGALNMGGMALTPAIVNNSGFGVAFQCRKTDGGATSAEVDAAWLTVYYTRAGDSRQTVIRLRAGRPPHVAYMDLQADGIRYSQRIRGANQLSFLLPKSHASVVDGSLYDALHADPDNPCMVTVESPDGYLNAAFFIVGWHDDIADGQYDFRAMDHTVRIAAGVLPQSGGGASSSGSLIRQGLQHIRQNFIDPYLDLAEIKDGPRGDYTFKADKGDRILREMENQTDWDFTFAYTIGADVRTLAVWNGPAGVDRGDEEVWQDSVHFTQRDYSIDYRQAAGGILAIGGNGTFEDRTSRFVSGSGRGVDTAVGRKTAALLHKDGFGGARPMLLPQTHDAAVIEQAAQSRLQSPDNAAEQLRITLYDNAIDRSRLAPGDLHRVRFSTMGKDRELDIRITGLDITPGSGTTGVECVVL